MCAKFPYVGLPGEMSSEPDFNKYMMVARRYMTKVHGFAATKQSDFRDHSWYSVDSITWKTSEIYGTLIHWDERKQLLSFDPDKNNRAAYTSDFIRHGLNAAAIIADTDYKEVTKYALISMRGMERHYEQRYAHRTFYYERRLPHPRALEKSVPILEIARLWASLKPADLFKKHQSENNLNKLRIFLVALACVQYKDYALLKTLPDALAFLQEYFAKLVTPVLTDEVVFQKELAAYLSPANPPPLGRVDSAHYIPTNNAPKSRAASSYRIEDLEEDVAKVPFRIEDI